MNLSACTDPRPGRLFIPSAPHCVEGVEQPVARPVVAPLTAQVEWQRTAFQEAPSSNRVNSAALVVPLRDTNGDGRRDGLDVPAVVVSTQHGWDSNQDRHLFLRALDGATGEPLWTSDGPQTGYVDVTPAAGDLDRDGRIDFVWSGGFVHALIVLDDQGHVTVDNAGTKSPKGWCAPAPEETGWSLVARGITLSDMDHDGYPEILTGGYWQGHDLSFLAYGLWGCGRGLSMAADILGGPEEEILAGGMAYGLDGEEVTGDCYRDIYPTSHGFPAVLDLDGDGKPEFLDVAGWGVYAIAPPHDVRFFYDRVGQGGPPAVADFDGDGRPEIAVANRIGVALLDDDGSELWKREYMSESGHDPCDDPMLAVVAFDFDGDGYPEVVIQNEERLLVLSGLDGTVRLEFPVQSYCPNLLAPVIADVDGDGQAEIVVTAKGSRDGPEARGVWVLGSAGKPWPTARRIWNQVNYFRDNVNDDGSIPKVAGKPWLTHNTFRSADLVTGKELWSSVDLVVRAGDDCLARCEGGDLKVQATVGNQGYVASTPGAKLVLYATVDTAGQVADTAGQAGPDATGATGATDATDADGDGSPTPAPSPPPKEVELASWTIDEAIEPGKLSSVHTFEVPLTKLSDALSEALSAGLSDAADPSALLGLHATVTPSAQDTEQRTDNNDTAWGLAPCPLP